MGQDSANDTSDRIAGRYELQEPLGSGGMGVVYRATDHTRHREIALKTLRSMSSTAAVRFKQEFRVLAGLSHPSLVEMYELVYANERYYVAMELVQGPEFLDYVRPLADSHGPALTTRTELSGPDSLPPPVHSTVAEDVAPGSALGLDYDRLSSAMWQLAEGLHFLHHRGVLHRDVKPSNVLVRASSDRIMLCDFGLAAPAQNMLQNSAMVGTWAYMAPEVVDDLPASPASDWYSFGVMLFQCLLGRLPFTETGRQVLTAKTTRPAPDPHTVDASIPDAWASLCRGLLEQDPEKRLTGAEVLARIPRPDGTTSAPGLDEAISYSTERRKLSPQGEVGTVTTRTVCIGRSDELVAVLAHVRGRAARSIPPPGSAAPARGVGQSSPAVIYLEGLSGMGKSTLARAALDTLSDDGFLILESRCNQAESVPFKALDGIVDQLSELLEEDAGWLIEWARDRNVDALLKLFPVLSRAGVLHSSPQSHAIPLSRLRRRAFAELRELLTAVHTHRKLVLYIDDLQWVDRDSVELLHALLDADNAPPLIVISTFRSNEVEDSAALRSLLASHGALGSNAHRHRVEPLSADGSLALALRLLPDGLGDDTAERIVRASGGNPFLIQELCTYAREVDSATISADEISLDRMLEARIARLSPNQRLALEVVCISGRATRRGTIEAALPGVDTGGVLATLRAHNLLTARITQKAETLEPFHDRVRENVVSLLMPNEVKARHRALAEVIETLPEPDWDALVTHWQGADVSAKVAISARHAAQEAQQAMGFDHAASLFQLVLEHDPEAADHLKLRHELASCLALAGRSSEAADAYLDLAEREPEKAQAHESAAALYLMGVGEIERGNVLLAQVSKRARVPLPRSEASALLLWLWRLLRLKFVKKRLPTETPTETQKNRLDVAWTVAQCLALSNVAASQAVATLGLLWAYRSADPQRYGRAVMGDILRHIIGSHKDRAKARFMLAQLERAPGVELDKIPIATYGRVQLDYQSGRFRECLASSVGALDQIRTHSGDDQWAIVSVQTTQTWALFYAGELRTFQMRVLEYRREAASSGSRYGMATFRLGLNGLAELCMDRPDQVLQNAQEAMRIWPKHGFQMEHFWKMTADVHAFLYMGRGEQAHATLMQAWPAFQRSGFGMIVPALKMEALYMLARTSLATPGVKGAAKLARKCATDIAKLQEPWYSGFGTLLRGLADAYDGSEDAGAHLAHATHEFEASGMEMFALVATLRRLALTDDKSAEYNRARTRLIELGVVNPEKLVNTFAPVAHRMLTARDLT